MNLDDTQKVKIKRFIGDKQMSETIRLVLKDSFLQNKNNEVHYLAAQALAVQLLETGFNRLTRYAGDNERDVKDESNPGL